MTTFEEAYALVRPHTLLSEQRCRVLWGEARDAMPGDFVEVGVYKGGSALLMHLANPSRHLHLFDTFEGHPDVQSAIDHPTAHPPGKFSDTSADHVRALLAAASVTMYSGIFPASFPADWSPLIALAHVDVDLYTPTVAAVHTLMQHVDRGAVVCDDYGDSDCPGVDAAVDEYVYASSDVVLFVPIGGQAILRRL